MQKYSCPCQCGETISANAETEAAAVGALVGACKVHAASGNCTASVKMGGMPEEEMCTMIQQSMKCEG